MSQAGGAIDLLPHDAGVTGMPRGFLDHVLMIRRSETARAPPGLATLAMAGRSGQARTTLSRLAPAGTITDTPMSRSWPEDPLEPVLLDPVQMPDEAEETGPGRHQRVRCCSPVSPRGHPDHDVAHLSEEVQQHPTLGARHIVARAVTRTVTRAARDQELSGWPATRKRRPPRQRRGGDPPRCRNQWQ